MRIVLALAAVALASAVQAATTQEQTGLDDNQLIALEEETNEQLLDSRDGGRRVADESDETGSRGRMGWDDGKPDDSDAEGGWKNDDIEKIVEIQVDENKGDKRGGYYKKNDENWADDNKVEYLSSGSERYEDIKPYDKNEQYNDYEKHGDVKPYEKNEKNSYQKNEEPKSQYGKPLQLSGLAEVIPDQQDTLTLNQIYRVQKDDAYGSGQHNTPYGQQGYNNQQLQILALLKFGRDFEAWNPRNNNSQWEWYGTEDGAPADNAAYIVKEGGHQKESAYGPNKDRSYVVQYSLPYNKYYNSSDPNNRNDYYEGVVQNKNNFSIGPTERLLYRVKFSCKIINAERNPFPSQVSNPWNDPRLAVCGIGITDSDSGVFFFIRVTNTGVWAQYGRRPSENQTAQTFATERLVGRRPRYDTVVDAAIEFYRREGKANYYLNGYLVWTIHAIGVLPPNNGITVMNRGQGEPQMNSISSVKVNFGTYKVLDRQDPNNPYNTQRLIRVRGNSTYYGTNDTFYDENNLKRNQLWGQGAIMTLLKLIVLKAESVILPQKALPGIYGAKQPKYQHASPYEG